MISRRDSTADIDSCLGNSDFLWIDSTSLFLVFVTCCTFLLILDKDLKIILVSRTEYLRIVDLGWR